MNGNKSEKATKFKQALRKMLQPDEDGNNEFRKIIKHKGYSRRERKAAENFYQTLLRIDYEVDGGIEAVSYIPLVAECKSYAVWQNIFAHMDI